MVCNRKYSSFRGCVRKCIFQLSIRALGLCVFPLAACALFSGCGEKRGEEFASLYNDMGEEFPYLSQDDLEEQLKLRLNENIYYKGGIVYDNPLLSYKGTTLDYVVLHQKSCDKEEEEYTQYIASILLQPQDEGLTTAMVDLTVYNGTLYALSLQGSLDRRVDLRDVSGAKEEIADLLGLTAEPGEVKIWYQGTLTVGNGEKPEYSDFNGKEARIAEIYEWTKNYLKMADLKEDARILIRDFRKEDGGTEILIEDKDGYMAPLLLPYYFYQENNFQHSLELNGDRYDAYIERFACCIVDN